MHSFDCSGHKKFGGMRKNALIFGSLWNLILVVVINVTFPGKKIAKFSGRRRWRNIKWAKSVLTGKNWNLHENSRKTSVGLEIPRLKWVIHQKKKRGCSQKQMNWPYFRSVLCQVKWWNCSYLKHVSVFKTFRVFKSFQNANFFHIFDNFWKSFEKAIGTGKWEAHELRQCAVNIEAAILPNWPTFTLQRGIKCWNQTMFNQKGNQQYR